MSERGGAQPDILAAEDDPAHCEVVARVPSARDGFAASGALPRVIRVVPGCLPLRDSIARDVTERARVEEELRPISFAFTAPEPGWDVSCW